MQHLASTETRQVKQGFVTHGSQLRVSPGINKRNIWLMIHLYHDDVLVMKKESQTVALRNDLDLFR